MEINTVGWVFRKPGVAEGAVRFRLRPGALRDVGWTGGLITARWAAEIPRYVGDPHLRLVREAAVRGVPVWKDERERRVYFDLLWPWPWVRPRYS